MKISVSGKGIDVGESLRAHIEKRVAEGVAKYLDRVTSVNVVISKESHLFRADVSGNTGTHANMVVKGRGQSADVYAAFDEAAQKIEKQLRRYKRRLTDHHKDKMEKQFDAPVMKATKYVIDDSRDEAADDAAALVIAEKSTDIETLTVSEAVMRMDLSDLPALMFFNSAHGRINVVYRRADGNISWVDPAAERAA